MPVPPDSLTGDDYTRNLIDSLPWSVLVLDRQGDIVDANAAAQSVLGSPLESLIGTPLSSRIFPPTDPTPDHAFIMSLLTDRDRPPIPCIITRDGTPSQRGDLYVRRAVKAPRSDRWVVSIRMANDPFAHEPMTRESAKMEAARALARHVANDFNNALVAINGQIATAITRMPLHTPGLGDIAGARRDVQRAARVVRRLLTAIEPAPSNREIVDPARIVNESVDSFRKDLEPHLSIELQFSHDDWMVNADVVQLSDVLIGLAYNALDAMSTGGTLRIVTTRTGGPDHDDRIPPNLAEIDVVRIDVIDDGTGIPGEILPHIFDPFFTTKGESGAGLGLARVYDILRQHGGDIAVESVPGVGTTFRIFLPRARQPQSRADRAAANDPPAGRETIVVIDDESSVRRIIKKTLEQRGYTVFEAADGKAGLALLGDLSPPADLVILDVLMPGLSGWDVLAELEKTPTPPPVIFQTGYAQGTDDVIKAHALLRKPYDLLDLVRMVRRVLDGNFPPESRRAG